MNSFATSLENPVSVDTTSTDSTSPFTWSGFQQPIQDFNLDNFDTEVSVFYFVYEFEDSVVFLSARF
jgi:hypothetical protein